MCRRPPLHRPQKPIAESFGTSDMHPAVSKIGKLASIRFSESVQVCFTTALDDYTDDEYFACWYSPDEYDEIEKDMMEQLRKMEDGQRLDGNSCSRGLEQYLTVNAIPKKQNVKKSIEAVLHRQLELRDYNDEAISEAYQNVSSSCLLWGAVVGRRDQQEAACAYDEEDGGGYYEDPAPSNNTLVKNDNENHDAAKLMVTLLKGAISTKMHEPSNAFVSPLLPPLKRNQGAAFNEGRCM